MKFLVKNKEEGYKIKEKVVKIANEWPYVFVSDILECFGRVPAPSAYEYAWPSDYIKNGKIQVRNFKDSWFLYIFGEPKKVNKKDPLPDIDVTVFETEIFEKLVKAIDDGFTKLLEGEQRTTDKTLEYLYNSIVPSFFFCTRPCIVKAKKSGRKEERQDRNAKFHRWADVTKSVHQVVAIVEFDDGHIEQVTPTRIIFYEEVEKCE